MAWARDDGFALKREELLELLSAPPPSSRASFGVDSFGRRLWSGAIVTYCGEGAHDLRRGVVRSYLGYQDWYEVYDATSGLRVLVSAGALRLVENR